MAQTMQPRDLKLAGSFENTGWDEETAEDLGTGVKLTRALVTQNFTGDIEGDGAALWQMVHRPNGTAHFVGLQRVRGTIAKRSGAFVLETTGEFDGKIASWTATIVPGSATDELHGLTGSGTFTAPHGVTAQFQMKIALESAEA